MAVNNDTTNKLYNANDTSVKFFASLTRAQAKGQVDFTYEGATKNIKRDFPGAICFVSDADGNSIFLNGLLFGDGAISGGGSGGGGGITEVRLDMIPVIEVDNVVLKTLADYFNANGTFITQGINVTQELQDGTVQTVISITSDGITIGNDVVVTQTYVTSYVAEQLSGVSQSIAAAEQNAKDYADSIISSVYKVKGSKNNYSELLQVQNPSIGDVWNVVAEVQGQDGKLIPEGTNFVWNGTAWDPLGGTFNLSNFYTKTEVESKLSQLETSLETTITNNVTNLQGQITTNANAISGLGLTQQQQAASIATNTANITQNTTNITNISTQLTWQ
jgi:hypothetical protein